MPPSASSPRPWLGIAEWIPGYRRTDLLGDLMAGTIVAIMLVPQAMAYARLAGLPPQVGLYASIVPVALYALFGSSRSLAVGPVAIVSLLVASALSSLATPGSAAYLEAALTLALLSGVLLLVLGFARLGFLVNFMSHSVVSGFTSAAAIVIAASQLKDLLGLQLARADSFGATLQMLATHAAGFDGVTLVIGVSAIIVLLLCRSPLSALLRRLHVDAPWIAALTKTGPLMVVVTGTLAVLWLDLVAGHGISVVGDIPAGLPALVMPSMDTALWRELLPVASLIAFVGFMESVSVAKALAARRRQRIDADRELIALGVANLGASFTGGYPVTGGFSRSVVNFDAGANTPLASLVTAVIVLLVAAVFTPLLHHLPQAALAAIVVVAVAGLIDVASLKRAWAYSRSDAAALVVTFVCVLWLGVELGILIGIAISLALHLYRTSRPHVAIVGRVGNSEHFRNVERHQVETCPGVLAMRIDESLYFANTRYLEDLLLGAVAARPEVEQVVLIFSAVNFIDMGALESLESLARELRAAGITLNIAEIKGPVSDRLAQSDFFEVLRPGRVFLSTHDAMTALGCPGTQGLAPPS